MTTRRISFPVMAALLLTGAVACSGTPAKPASGRLAGQTGPVPGPAAPQPSATSVAGPPAADGGPVSCSAPGRTVSTAAQLTAALASARPGTTITLAAGVYHGDFVASVSGTSTAPISLCGDRNATLDGPSTTSGYTFHLDHASWWHLVGFTVEGGQKGVMTDESSDDIIYGLYVHGIGDEGIHLRSFSSDDIVSHNVIRDTGLNVQFYGEGIYVGSAHENWCLYTGCGPDESNDDILIDNNIADTTAENIDIKEGTTGGTITGNVLNGTGMVGSAATAWINVKGNNWKILDNVGTDSILDGYSVHQVYPGWGIGNTFIGNQAALTGTGVGIYVQSHHLQTVIACNNTVTGVPLSNLPCQSVN